MNDTMFLDTITASFKRFLTTGSRSNEKLKILHGAIAEDLKMRLCGKYSICSLGYGNGKEGTIEGRYVDKKTDITVFYGDEAVAGIAIKFVMQNYSQNSNNYFENMLGETANIRSKHIPYFQIFVIPDKMPYYDNRGYLRKWEEFSFHNAKKYLALSKDDIQQNVHTPTKTLLYVIHLPDIDEDIVTKADYIERYLSMAKLKIKKTNKNYGIFDKSVIFNDYESFIEKTVHYIMSI